ncbi:MAG: response regulator transcription factor [Deltaproteobacteria bacterium]|nr:response regulator transcription factor [Deltaproteobacteria bacterium]
MYRILIVEDDVIIAEELEYILTSAGYDVIKTLYSAEEAPDYAKKLMPALILMDILFPEGMDGITAARIIKRDLDLPVMFFTGSSELEMVERAKDLEPVGYVVKPFHEAQVISNVRLAFHQIKINKALQMAHDQQQEANDRLEERVSEKTVHLEEANTALRVLLRKRDQDKVEFEEKILTNAKLLIEPHLESLKNSGLDPNQNGHLSLMESGLKEIVSPFSQRLTSKYVGLTPGELEVAYLVKEGKRTKDIAEVLNLSGKTIEDYRKQLRSKLGITNQRINLRTYLLSLQ